jgi:hypothetical protein
VAAQERGGREGAQARLGDRAVGEEHELFHHLVGLAHGVHAHVERVVRLAVDLEADLRRGELERASRGARGAQPPRERGERLEPDRDVVRRARVVQPRLRLGVRQCRARADDRLREARRQHLGALRRHLPDHREREAVDARAQRADVLRQRLWQHVEAALHQVGRRRARGRLGVDRGTWEHKVRHVRDVDAHFQVAAGQPRHVERVVDVAAAGRVDGADGQCAEVGARGVGELGGADGPGERRDARVDGGGEGRGRDVVLGEDDLRHGGGVK